MKPPVTYLFVQHTCPEFSWILANNWRVFPLHSATSTRSMSSLKHLCLERHSCHHSSSNYQERETLADQKRIPQRLICRCSLCAWVVWVFSLVQRVPTAGPCPKILFCIVTRSLACFCRALGCCVRRLTTLAISAFICPCPKLQYAWDSFWQFPLATLCTADTQDHWSCQARNRAPQKAIQGSMRNMQGTMRICWLFGLPSTQKLCTNQPHVLCPCSNLSACCDPFS